MKPDSLCPFKDDRCRLGKCGFCERLRQARQEGHELGYKNGMKEGRRREQAHSVACIKGFLKVMEDGA